MRVEGALLVVAAASAVLGLAAAHFPHPGSFHNIMMMIGKKDGMLSWKGPTKMARIAPSPHRMWALIDPPGSLGSLGDDSIHTNRITRSLKSIDEETNENVESPSPSRVVRSLSNRREARTEEDEAVTEALEDDITEAPEINTVAPEEEVVEEEVVEEEVVEEEVVEEEVVEEETEPPVTTPAPVVCGGDLSVDLDPNNLPTDAEGRILHEHILSPGFEDGEYPDQEFECEWTIGVGTECQMGMLMFMVNEGEIRETARCEEDHLAVSYRGEQESKFCGMLKQGQHQVTGTDIWTEPTPLAMRLSFRVSERSASFRQSAGKPLGFNMTISCYCWIWTPEFLAKTTTAPPTTPTTTEAPIEEPVTIIAVDGPGYEDEEVTEAEDIVTEAPQENGFDDSGERFFDITNDLESIDDISDPLVPELSSTISIGSLSSIASLISDISLQDGTNILEDETPNIDVMNTEALNPILSEAEILPIVPVQSDPLPIIPGNLVPTSHDDNDLVPELSSATSVDSLSSIATLISDLPLQEGSNILDPETSNTGNINTEALTPIVPEAELLPIVPVQPGSLPIIPGNLVPTSQDDDPLVPELSSATSVESLSSITSLISDLPLQEGSNILDADTSNTDDINTEALSPIVPESGLLPFIPVQPGPLPIIPGNLVPTSQDSESILNTNPEEEASSSSAISSLVNTDSKVSEPEEPIPVDTKPVPIDSNPQVEKPVPNNPNKPSGANKPNKKPNKNKPTKPPMSFIPIKPLRDDSNLMESDVPFIGEKINFEPIINQLLAQ